jgi:8-amino-7-oxononanoate synthase
VIVTGTADREIQRDPLAWLADRAAARTAAGLRRRLRPRGPHADLLDLAGNDYLGLTRHPEVVQAVVDAVREWGAGSTGSRLVTGSTLLHAELESALAGHLGTEAALVFSSGYLANLGAVTVLASRDDLVVSDAYNHASIIDACRLSGARIAVTAHRDVTAVAAVLAGRTEERALVVTESIFSVDGDLAPMAELHRVCRRFGAVLLVDEAHALGVIGPGGQGAAAAAGIAHEPDVVLTVTLSKSLASQGGALLGSRRVIEHAVDAGRPFIFDTGLAPACASAALAALKLLIADPRLAADVRRSAASLAGVARNAGLSASEPAAAVVGVPLASPGVAVTAAEICARHGVRVGCFRPPSVPDGVSRLRLTAHAGLAAADLDQLGAALREVSQTRAIPASATPPCSASRPNASTGPSAPTAATAPAASCSAPQASIRPVKS